VCGGDCWFLFVCRTRSLLSGSSPRNDGRQPPSFPVDLSDRREGGRSCCPPLFIERRTERELAIPFYTLGEDSDRLCHRECLLRLSCVYGGCRSALRWTSRRRKLEAGICVRAGPSLFPWVRLPNAPLPLLLSPESSRRAVRRAYCQLCLRGGYLRYLPRATRRETGDERRRVCPAGSTRGGHCGSGVRPRFPRGVYVELAPGISRIWLSV
jgi:hypothetical protein